MVITKHNTKQSCQKIKNNNIYYEFEITCKSVKIYNLTLRVKPVIMLIIKSAEIWKLKIHNDMHHWWSQSQIQGIISHQWILKKKGITNW